MTGENFETTTVEEISTVEICDSCGTDLSDIEPSAHEQRVLRDIKDVKVDAEIKDCPECRARTKGRFPENMPGPLQYGNGIKAFVINLLVTQMVDGIVEPGCWTGAGHVRHQAVRGHLSKLHPAAS